MIIIYRHVLLKGMKLSLLTIFFGRVSYYVILKAAKRIWNVPHKSFSYPAAYTILFAENNKY